MQRRRSPEEGKRRRRDWGAAKMQQTRRRGRKKERGGKKKKEKRKSKRPRKWPTDFSTRAQAHRDISSSFAGETRDSWLVNAWKSWKNRRYHGSRKGGEDWGERFGAIFYHFFSGDSYFSKREILERCPFIRRLILRLIRRLIWLYYKDDL